MANLNETKSFTFNFTESIDFNTGSINTNLVHVPYSLCQTCVLFCCPCRPWADYTDGNLTLQFNNSCTFCCNWTVAQRDRPGGEFKDVGLMKRAGCCDNGFINACCPCCICNFPNYLVSTIHAASNGQINSDTDKADFSIRRDIACGDSCYLFAGLCCFPFISSCSFCCKYCDGQTGVKTSVPFWSSEGTTKERYGEFVFAYRLTPIGCCCIRMPVRFSVSSNKALDANSNYNATLGMVPVLAAGLPTPTAMCCPCCLSVPVDTPSGISCFDRGLHATTTWQTFEQMIADTNPDVTTQTAMQKPPMQAGGLSQA
jgi:hypothetical protein